MASRKLALYNKKRDFKKTAEPSGTVSHSQSQRSFLVQKHVATRLHYDFRLEMGGVLKSWAVTRGPSLNPNDKRLAVEVEDHPVSYGGFEGIIPKGEYGGGTVMMWDEGTWEPLGDPAKDLKAGHLKFRLHGKRLQGEWVLVRMKPRPQDKGRHNWLLIKHEDAYSKTGKAEVFLAKNNTSITSKRSMEEIASAADRQWKSKPNAHSTAGTSPPIGKKQPSGSRLKFIAPQLATLVDAMPSGDTWVHEVKFDGYRTLAYIENGRVRMYTRNGLDWTEKFGAVPAALAKLKVKNAILDGELVAINADGITSFAELKTELSGTGKNLSYYAFDLLHLNGKDLTNDPLRVRKEKLEALLKKQTIAKVFYSEHFTQAGNFLDKACALGLEGVISKEADAPYRSGRGKSWVKTKCHKRQEFVVGGYTKSSTGTAMIGSLLLGYYEGKDFVYAGRVGTGFDQKTARSLYKALKALERTAMPYTRYSDQGRRGTGWKRGVQWVEPRLVCEVEFTEWTKEGALRHPSFQGLREDKPAKEITRDIPQTLHQKNPRAVKKVPPQKSQSSVPLTHPDKVLFSPEGYTKQDLSNYYAAVEKWMLPHVVNRPLSLVRCPSGSQKHCFFQRHSGEGLSKHITPLPLYAKEEPYLMIEDAAGLQALVQMSVLEIHQWGSHADSWQQPDMLVFDLDPDPSVDFAAVKKAALELRKHLASIKLKSFVKTTGGKGLHVVVPIRPEQKWDEVKQFAREFCEAVADAAPERYTTNIRKAQRKGRIFLDYLRNGETATAIAPYSSRARKGAPVAVPLRWSELPKVKSGDQWTIRTLPKRLAQLKSDPWKDLLKTKQSLPRLKPSAAKR